MSTLALTSYRLLGRSGLRVSPLSLGAMTFGEDMGWGANAEVSRRMFDLYVDRGGNFIDTANVYTRGTSETLLGEFMRGKRNRIILATKYALTMDMTDPNAGGNSRKTMMTAVEASLKRLGTDYIDLYYMHAWDNQTPVEEILRGMDDLVRAGKVLYVGMSDIPAWQAARMQTIADLRGWSPLVALQVEYSLIQREIERDLVPMARELGLGVIPWSPLGAGVLSGKYTLDDLKQPPSNQGVGDGTRKQAAIDSGRVNERTIALAEIVKQVAGEIGRKPTQVALAWVLSNSAVTSPIIGARTVEQLEDNLGALTVQLSDAQRQRLDEASAIKLGFPHDFLQQKFMQAMMSLKTVTKRT